jgi:hypothetical protein
MNLIQVKKVNAGEYQVKCNDTIYTLDSMYCVGSKPQWVLEGNDEQLVFEFKSSAIEYLKSN